MRLGECGAVAAAAVRSVWQRCQIYRGARDIWSRTSVHDAPRDVDEVFDDLFDEKVPNVSQSDWAVAVHPEGVKRKAEEVPVSVVKARSHFSGRDRSSHDNGGEPTEMRASGFACSAH